MTQRKPSVTVVVPVYNSEGTLRELVARLEPVLRGVAEQFEVILLNDGSRDRSWDVISELAKTHPWIRGVCMMRNYGQHNAVLCGVRLARYEITVTMDDDLQHPPEEIPKLLAKLDDGYDVVYGTPLKMEHSISRNLLSRVTKLGMSWAVGERVIVEINAYRALRTSLRQSFEGFQAPNLLFDAILGWGTTRFSSIKVQHATRTIGQSNYTPMRLANQLLLLITGYSTGPLRLGSIIGFAFTLLGLGLLTYVVVVRLMVGSPLGFAFQVSILAMFGGAQLFVLGIMGEYLARMFNRTMDRPTYAIREIVGSEPGSDQ